MKTIFRILVLAALVTVTPMIALAGSAKYRLAVDGLACPFCAYGIEKKLMAAEGVMEIEVDIDAGVITVTMAQDATMTEEQASQAVEDAGFTLADFDRLSSDDAP